MENRGRLLREVTEAVLSVWEPGQVGVRISPTNPFNDIADSSPQATFETIVEQLNQYGLGYLHVVEDRTDGFNYQELRHIFNGAYMANGGYERDSAITRLKLNKPILLPLENFLSLIPTSSNVCVSMKDSIRRARTRSMLAVPRAMMTTLPWNQLIKVDLQIGKRV